MHTPSHTVSPLDGFQARSGRRPTLQDTEKAGLQFGGPTAVSAVWPKWARREAARGARAAFTLVETVIAVSISTIVLAGMLSAFIWVMQRTAECQHFSWAQTEAAQASQRIVAVMRNGLVVTNIDVSGNWVDIVMTTNATVARFSYVNPSGLPGQGRLLYVPNIASASGPTNELARGVTKVMTPPSRNVFEWSASVSNLVRVAFRVTKPAGGESYPAEVEIGARLRNF